MTPTWFQQQLNEESKRIGKIATNRLSLELPQLHPGLLRHFELESSVQMAANVISNYMLQYFMEQITALVTRRISPEEDGLIPLRSLVDPETKQIKLYNLFADSEEEIVNSVIMFLKMEIQGIEQQMIQAQKEQGKTPSGLIV